MATLMSASATRSTPFKPELGDILSGGEFLFDHRQFIPAIKERGFKHALLPANLGGDPFNFLAGGAAAEANKHFHYICPWRGTRYYHFLPMIIASVREAPGVRDDTWADTWFQMCLEEFEGKHADIMPSPESGWAKAGAGHGYTSCTLPSDGDGEWQHAALLLSDGTVVLGIVWVWFNK